LLSRGAVGRHKVIERGQTLGLLSVGEGVEEAEELLDVGDLQRRVKAIVHTNESQGTPFLIVSDVGADQRADPGGIDVGNAGEIHDEGGRPFGTNCSLELEQGSKHNGALKTEDALAGLGPVEVLDIKWLLRLDRHPEILAAGAGRIITGMLIFEGCAGNGAPVAGWIWKQMSRMAMQRGVQKMRRYNMAGY
jgi:hypothetical protein